ncbi:hypothetical protein HK405_000125 [Cladochytrium tenue]|nr:hypothetical protein HK405_000125 [Cladochytrium tenue]
MPPPTAARGHVLTFTTGRPLTWDDVGGLEERSLGERGGSAGGGDSVQERVLSTLLNEMDGIEAAPDVLVFVPAPDFAARLKILQVHTRGMPLSGTVDLEAIADETELYTGADLEALCREAAVAAMRERMLDGKPVTLKLR